MKKILHLFFVSIIFWGCEKEPEAVQDEVIVVVGQPSGNNGNTSGFDDIYGISNVVNYQGSMYTLVSYAPKNNFPGYPDAGTFFYEYALLNIETGTTYAVENQAVADQSRHSDLVVTPDNRLAMVYQKPTGYFYGFDLMYKEFANGAFIRTSKVFHNANAGAWPRLSFSDFGDACVVSFAHDCYQLWYFQENGTVWSSSELSYCGNYYADTQFQMIDNTIFLSTLEGGGYLLWAGVGSNQLTTEYVDVDVTGNGAMALDDWGDFSVVYSKGSNIMYAQRVWDGFWDVELVDEGQSAGHRIALAFDHNDNPIVAFQSNNKVKVLQKTGNAWTPIFQVYIPAQNMPPSDVGRGPSLVKKGAQLFLVYADFKEVSVKRLL